MQHYRSDASRARTEYLLYRLFTIDMDSVRHGLAVLRRYRRDDVRFPLLRDVVVTYSRPFSGSKRPEGSLHFLSLKFVPRAMRSLHHELVSVRSTLFAHSDLVFHNPELLRDASTPRRVIAMSFSNADYRGLLRKVDAIGSLAEAVETSLWTELRRLESLF